MNAKSIGTLLVAILAYVLVSSDLKVWAQNSNGKVAVTVLDQAGALVPGVHLQLKDLATNDVRVGTSSADGTYRFVDVTYGNYSLTASLGGFETAVIGAINVQTARTTDVSVTLHVGSTSTTVEVTAEAAPLVEATSNAIGTTIDMKQIEQLPLGGRDITGLSALVPGYADAGNGYFTWNGVPMAAQGNNIDGVVADTSRFKDFGNPGAGSNSQVAPRIEAIGEMTVQTDQLDLNQGFGTTTMQVNYVTRRGSNQFHGRAYDDFQNDGLNANSWFNNAIGQPRGKLIIDDFGATLGGPIIKDKLFFFGDYSERKVPGTLYLNNNVLSAGAQQGNYSYVDTTGQARTINLLQVAGGLGLQSNVNPAVGSVFSKINTSAKSGILGQIGNDPNLLTLNWTQPSPTTIYYPTVRLDYNASENLRLYGSWVMSKASTPNAIGQSFPGSGFSNTGGGNGSSFYTTALGVDWTLSPNLINQFKGGFLYYYQFNGTTAPASNVQQPRVLFFYPGGNFWMSGDAFTEPQSNFYPRFDVSDTMTWHRGAHTLNYGASWYREQDHYWNPPIGYPWVSIGLTNGDPAFNAFTNGPTGTLPNASDSQLGEAEQLYAVLTGRITQVSGNTALDVKTKQYVQYGAPALNELQQGWGLFLQDSWHVKPNLTVNYGLRWDFTGDDHDLNGMYHSVTPADIYGPSGYGIEFAPGVLKGNMNPMFTTHGHQYSPWNVSPQPAIGLAWSPGRKQGLLASILGHDTTVVRAGYSLRRFTPSYQNFWSYASNYGAFFEGAFFDNPFGSGPGSFQPGSLFLGDQYPPYNLVPPQYLETAPESINTFNGGGPAGINPHIAQPYVQSWNIGIQRQLGNSQAIEVRYIGTKSTHLWLGLNVNEANVFESGFLPQFKAAQNNLAINKAHGIASFANNGFAGQQALPLFDAAFAGESAGGTGVPLADYSNGFFMQLLQQGQVGTLAQQFAGGAGPQYLCNLIGGANFGPCGDQGFTGNGAGYPINIFQANPFAAGQGASYLASVGYANYNALQIEFRQKQWHGMQFNANYTWSHALGLTGGNGQPGPNQFDNGAPIYTMRNLRLNYGPMPFDVRHVVHLLGTYDLPFGRGRQYLNRSGLLDRFVGGWTLGTIFTFQTGSPFNLLGGYNTFNNFADGGVLLNGITPSQLQSSVGVYHNGTPTTYLLNPSQFAAANGQANPTYFTANNNAGTLAPVLWLFGPSRVYDDMSITKSIPIRENIHFSLQAEFLNAFNHPVWGSGPTGAVQSNTFGAMGVLNAPRAIELRANIEF